MYVSEWSELRFLGYVRAVALVPELAQKEVSSLIWGDEDDETSEDGPEGPQE